MLVPSGGTPHEISKIQKHEDDHNFFRPMTVNSDNRKKNVLFNGNKINIYRIDTRYYRLVERLKTKNHLIDTE